VLPLHDPLWAKLDDAHRDRDIPDLLAGFAQRWDDAAANSLFWDCLCHQGTCYGATYAAVPHLLAIAEPAKNWNQRLQIALFLGFVALCALERRDDSGSGADDAPLSGLPETLAGWDEKLDVYRRLVARSQPRATGQRAEVLRRWQRLLALAPVDKDDLAKIQVIKAEFLAALPRIKAVCERALLEDRHDGDAAPYLLSGIAATTGLTGVARLLNFGSDGLFECASCGCQYEFIRFGERVAIYTGDSGSGASRSAAQDRALRDFKEGRPARADGVIDPIDAVDGLNDRAKALLALADRVPSTTPAILLRHFLGSIVCGKCGMRGSVKPV
jgi:hypothetical protein